MLMACNLFRMCSATPRDSQSTDLLVLPEKEESKKELGATKTAFSGQRWADREVTKKNM